MSRAISVLIVDDHELIRAGIKRILEDAPNIRVVGEASDGDEAMTLIRETSPNVIIMDIKMPGMSGLATTEKIIRQYPEVRILAVSAYDDDLVPVQLLQAGAMGYLTKDANPTEMVQAVKSVCAGQRYISQGIAKQLSLKNNRSALDSLSERETQVMLMISNGSSVREIAEELALSPKTINSYRYRVFEKLSIKNDVELALLAIKHGLLEE